MSLFQKIANEAYDEDMKYRREALDRNLEQVKIFATEYSEPISELDASMKLTFTRLFTVFSNEIDKSIQQYFQEALVKDTGNLTLFYNQLASFVNGITTQKLSQTNISATNLIRKIDSVVPKLTQLYTIAKEQNYTDKNAVKEILENIKSHNFDQVALVFDKGAYDVVLKKNNSFKDSVYNANLLFDKITGNSRGNPKLYYLSATDYADIFRSFDEFQDIKNQYIEQMGSPNISSAIAKQKVDKIVRDLQAYENVNVSRNKEALKYEDRVLFLKGRISNVDMSLITQLQSNIAAIQATTPTTMTEKQAISLQKTLDNIDSDFEILTTMIDELVKIETQLIGKTSPFTIVMYKEFEKQLKNIEANEKEIHDKYASLIRSRTGPQPAYLTDENGSRAQFGTQPTNLVNSVSIPDDNIVPIPRIREEAIAPLPLPIMQANNIPVLLSSNEFEVSKRSLEAAKLNRVNITNKQQAEEARKVLEAKQKSDKILAQVKAFYMKKEKITGAEFDEDFEKMEAEKGRDEAIDILLNSMNDFYRQQDEKRQQIKVDQALRKQGKAEKIKEKDIEKQKKYIGEADYDVRRFKEFKDIIFKQILASDKKFTNIGLNKELSAMTEITKNRLTSLNMMSETYLDKSIGEIADIEDQPVMEVGLEGQGRPSHFRGYTGGMDYDGE